MSELDHETLVEVAREIALLRQMNPMNGDGQNNMLDRVLTRLDSLAGDEAPTRAAEDAWDVHMDLYEQRYYGGDGQGRQRQRAKNREARL